MEKDSNIVTIERYGKFAGTVSPEIQLKKIVDSITMSPLRDKPYMPFTVMVDGVEYLAYPTDLLMRLSVDYAKSIFNKVVDLIRSDHSLEDRIAITGSRHLESFIASMISLRGNIETLDAKFKTNRMKLYDISDLTKEEAQDAIVVGAGYLLEHMSIDFIADNFIFTEVDTSVYSIISTLEHVIKMIISADLNVYDKSIVVGDYEDVYPDSLVAHVTYLCSLLASPLELNETDFLQFALEAVSHPIVGKKTTFSSIRFSDVDYNYAFDYDGR